GLRFIKMKHFLDEQFLLNTKTAQSLYHDYAADMPIIDYHCHLPSQQIAENTQFDNITQVWLNGDHYKWRAMRTNGVDESYITGDRPDREKFRKWAETVPYTLRNPLYHWTHLELKRYFGISELLTPDTADRIFDEASEKLRSPEYRVRGLLKRMNVKVICTTDDPLDTLGYHQALAEEGYGLPVYPAFRPDAAMDLSDTPKFRGYVSRLAVATNRPISHFTDFLSALKERHDFFAKMGCRVSDHGLEEIFADKYTDGDIERIFKTALNSGHVSRGEHRQFKS